MQRPLRRQTFSRFALLTLALFAACGGGSGLSTGVDGLTNLRGESIGLVSLDGIPSLELRYVLQEGAGIDSRALGGEVRYAEAPVDSLSEMLEDSSIEVALVSPQSAYALQDEPGFAVRTHVAAAMRDITGAPVMATALLVPRDEAQRRPKAISAARRLLRDSASYFRSNQDSVLDAVVEKNDLDAAYAAWLAPRQRIALGDASRAVQRALAALWAAGVEMGDIAEAPSLEETLVRDGDGDEPGLGRQTVSIAVLDDALHRGALYAIEQGLVDSDEVDLAITYLSPSALTQAVEAREYDIVEATPMLLVTGRNARLDLMVLSGGVEDLDSTLLFDYSRSRR